MRRWERETLCPPWASVFRAESHNGLYDLCEANRLVREAEATLGKCRRSYGGRFGGKTVMVGL
ncbi:unnamed protein product [Ectocarpus sp. 12 AP-2014]